MIGPAAAMRFVDEYVLLIDGHPMIVRLMLASATGLASVIVRQSLVRRERNHLGRALGGLLVSESDGDCDSSPRSPSIAGQSDLVLIDLIAASSEPRRLVRARSIALPYCGFI